MSYLEAGVGMTGRMGGAGEGVWGEGRGVGWLGASRVERGCAEGGSGDHLEVLG